MRLKQLKRELVLKKVFNEKAHVALMQFTRCGWGELKVWQVNKRLPDAAWVDDVLQKTTHHTQIRAGSNALFSAMHCLLGVYKLQV